MISAAGVSYMPLGVVSGRRVRGEGCSRGGPPTWTPRGDMNAQAGFGLTAPSGPGYVEKLCKHASARLPSSGPGNHPWTT
jgi:hypothetical protein